MKSPAILFVSLVAAAILVWSGWRLGERHRTLQLVTAETIDDRASSYPCEITEPPDEQLLLAHFWTFGVGNAEFGIREWRYSGNPAVGKSPRSFTTVFLGPGDVDVRLPAFTVIGLFGIGGGLLALLAATLWIKIHRARV